MDRNSIQYRTTTSIKFRIEEDYDCNQCGNNIHLDYSIDVGVGVCKNCDYHVYSRHTKYIPFEKINKLNLSFRNGKTIEYMDYRTVIIYKFDEADYYGVLISVFNHIENYSLDFIVYIFNKEDERNSFYNNPISY